MKFQTKNKTAIAAAMFLASILSSSVTALPASADTVSAGKTIAAANGIILDSDTDAAELAVLNDLNGGALPVLEFADACTVSHIDGLISGRTVRNERSAKAAIASVGGLLGIQDADSELRFIESDSDEYDTVYTFRQLYQGVPVEDAFVAVFADAETLKADYLNSSFVTGLSLNTTPAISADRVRDIVRATYQSGLMKEPELMIIRGEDGVRRLAYEATAYDLNVGAVYISAEDGRVLRGPAASVGNTYENIGYPDGSYKWEKDYANPVTGLKKFSILETCCKVNGQDKRSLHDAHRSIYMINDEGNVATNELEKMMREANNNQEPDCTKSKTQRFLDTLDMTKYNKVYQHDYGKPCKNEDFVVGVKYQVERVYDYFCDAFNWRGTANLKKSNRDATSKDRLFVIPFHGAAGRAYCYHVINVIGFGAVNMENPQYNHSAKEIAVVAHEYTHRILDNKLLWSTESRGWDGSRYYGEVAALDEAYADIMGQYAELAVKGSINWKTGDIVRKNGDAFRDLTKGEYYENPARTENMTAKHYFKTSECASTSALESHDGATIIGHAAYRMSRSFAPSDAQQIWFNSIDYLKGTGCKFRNCRAAVVKAAKEFLEKTYVDDEKRDYSLLRKEMLVKVYSAFNYAEIFPGNSKPMGDINKDGIINADDVALTKRYANNVNLLTDPEQIALGDVNYDGRITKQDAQIIQNHINQYGNRRTWEYHFHYDI